MTFKSEDLCVEIRNVPNFRHICIREKCTIFNNSGSNKSSLNCWVAIVIYIIELNCALLGGSILTIYMVNINSSLNSFLKGFVLWIWWYNFESVDPWPTGIMELQIFQSYNFDFWKFKLSIFWFIFIKCKTIVLHV